MNLSRTQILLFFLTLSILAWLLYPRDFFLGYIYEGVNDFQQSENYYLKYLKKHPNNKRAILRLADLYQRMAQPEKASPLLKNLYLHRNKDWKIAQIYLDHLENLQDSESLYQARLLIADNFLTNPRLSSKKVETELLYPALEYALWKQRYEEAYQILEKLIPIAKNPQDYRGYIRELDSKLQKTNQTIAYLKQDLSRNPKDYEARLELVAIYDMLDNQDEAIKLANEGLLLFPKDLVLLKRRALLYHEVQNKEAQIQDIQTILGLKNLDDEEKLDFEDDLANLFSQTGKIAQAIEIWQKHLAQNPLNKKTWDNIIYAYLDHDQIDQALITLEKYLQLFPQDLEKEKLLLEIYLYKKKDIQRLAEYKIFIQKTHSLSFALDVAYLLSDKHLDSEELTWLESMRPLFPKNEQILKLLSELYYEKKDYEKVLALQLLLLKKHPSSSEITQRIAEIYNMLGSREKALEYFEKLAQLKTNDSEIQKLVGKELFFQSFPKKALKYLQAAAKLNPKDPETWFWISEVYTYELQKKEAQEAAQKVITLLSTSPKLSEEESRMKLKSEGKIAWNKNLNEAYKTTLLKYPKNLDLRADYIDLLLENHQLKNAQAQIDQLEKISPNSERILPYQIRMAFEKRHWKLAINGLRQLIDKNPSLLSYRRDLAEAYYQNGQWREALREYESVEKQSGDEFKVRKAIREIHENYDHRVGFNYHFLSLGSDDIMEWKSFYQGYLRNHWKMNAEMVVGRFTSSAINYEGLAEYGKVSFSRTHLQNWLLTGALSFGVSDPRTTLSPEVGAQYKIAENANLGMGYQYRSLRVDFPQAVAAGTLEDIAYFNWQYSPLEWFTFSGDYEWNRNYLPNSAQGFGNQVDVALNFRILKKPNFTLGYQYTFSNNTGQAFLNQVPLIPKMSVHYLIGNVSQQVAKNLFLEAGFFVGEDTTRQLHIYEGDLWNVRSLLKWNINKNFDLNASYEYGREALFNVPGQTHNLNIGFSGHWK